MMTSFDCLGVGRMRRYVALLALAAAGCQQGGAPPQRTGGYDFSQLPVMSSILLADLRRHPDLVNTVRQAAQPILARPPTSCGDARVAIGPVFDIIVPPTRNAAGEISGTWVERTDVANCPGATYARVLVNVRASRVGAAVADHGTGISSIALINDALTAGKAPATVAMACPSDQVRLSITRFEGFTGSAAPTLPGRDGRPWREIWTFTGCGKLGEIAVQFTPDQRGTAFSTTAQVQVRPL